MAFDIIDTASMLNVLISAAVLLAAYLMLRGKKGLNGMGSLFVLGMLLIAAREIVEVGVQKAWFSFPDFHEGVETACLIVFAVLIAYAARERIFEKK
jgi:hypothetical protein